MPVLLQLVLLLLVLVAAVYDLRLRRIPNWLNLSGVVVGFGSNILLAGAAGLRVALLGFLCALAVYLPLYLLRGMGAGDVKLMAAVGSIAGPEYWLQIFLAAALVGGLVALFALASKQRVLQTLNNVGLIANELIHLRAPAQSDPRFDYRHQAALRLPHGAAIAGGSIAFLLIHKWV